MPFSPLTYDLTLPIGAVKNANETFENNAVLKLTAPGQPLEISCEPVDGVDMKVFRNRPRHIADLLQATTAYPDRVCITDGNIKITYGDFLVQVKSLASGLRSRLNVQPGTRVAILAANRSEWIIAMWAIIYAGGTVVALNGWWKPTEIEEALRSTQCAILIGDQKRLDQAGPLSGIHVVSFDPQASDDVMAFAELKASAPLSRPVAVSENDTAAILFTSGTTGKPNGVLISHRAWIAGLMNALTAISAKIAVEPELASTNETVRLLASLPFFHAGGGHGAAITGIASGATLVIPPEKFNPNSILSLIQNEEITRWSAVPAMVQAVCLAAQSDKFDLSSLNTLGYGAAPSGSRLLELAHATFPNLAAISNAYGLTETSSVIAMNTGDEFRARPESVGRAFATAEIRITDDDDCALPAYSRGNIQIRGPFLVSGFIDGREEAPFAEGRWLRTGDIGYLDEAGFLFLVDRKKDVIIRGGENIFAGEVERRLEMHPDILEAAVVPFPCERLGEGVRTVLRVKDNTTLSIEDVQDWVGQSLAIFKVPEIVEVSLSPLPRNQAGKLMKRQIRAATFPRLDMGT